MSIGYKVVGARAIIKLTSLPVCWDTLRARTNKGYFELKQITFLAHIAISYKLELSMYLGYIQTLLSLSI
jgi:hypothetical protein